MERENSYSKTPDNTSAEDDAWWKEEIKLNSELATAEENFKNSVGREEYAKNIRIRDTADKAIEAHESSKPMNVDELGLELQRAERSLKHAQNQQEYEDSIRRVDEIQTKMGIKGDSAETK